MSSSRKRRPAQQNGKGGVVPNLRFPAFRDEPMWSQCELGRIADILKGKGIAKADLDPRGSQACIRYGELYTRYAETIRDVLSRTSVPASELLLSKPGDVIIPSSGETKDDIARASCVLVADVALGADLNVIRSTLNGTFLSYYLNGPKRLDIARVAQGDAVVHLYPHQLEALRVAIPAPDEQREIAECLSSVDELARAQVRKVHALKMHKKGLVQQLIPREGEAQPRLRFPDFRNDREWEVCELGPKTSKIGSGITPAGGDKNYKSEGRPFVRSQNVGWGILSLDDVAYIDNVTHASFDATEIKLHDVLLNITGGSIGRSVVADERVVGGNVNQHVCIIRTKQDELCPWFLNQYLLSRRGQDQIDSFQAGGNRQGLNFAQIRSFAIPLPPELAEQQRVGACLSGLDDLIAVETSKLDILRRHKRGLMEQLFPTAEEAGS